MKKLIGTILCTFLILLIFSCEKDDFCITNPVTPNLVIRFYDATDEDETKDVIDLSVWVAGKDSLYASVTADSIAIPLNTLATNTVYNLSKGTDLLETFTIDYTTEDEFISRSCGFRVIFNDVNLNNDATVTEEAWISSFTPNTITTINEQETAHVKIFH